ncbi:uncharacterized protein [Misgurnus anguillicaudatus]|uniref:uncharacterized protein n=1 Tax=Misgurnus anguillicaudatus TaxID=75329 RepID=UPI003CCF344D
MVHTCVVAGCRNRRTPGSTLSFYRFPRDPQRKQRWIAAVNREGWIPNEGSRLCSTHFISGKQVKNPRSPDYIPSVFTTAPLSPNMKEASACELYDKQEAQVEAANALLFLQGQGRFLEDSHQIHSQEETESVSSSLSSCNEEEDDNDDEDDREEEISLTSIIQGDKPVINIPTTSSDYQSSLEALKKENMELRESVEKMSLTEASFRNDPEKVRFYTGLPNYFVFETVMLLLLPHMKGDKNTKLSKFQQLLLTLMRLRLDLRNKDLAYRFGIKVATVTRTVHRIINIMFTTLVPTAVFWPSRVELRKNLPASLRSTYPDCAVIIDCFRVSLEKEDINQQVDSMPTQSALVNELKYVIGVAPQGVVMFVSSGSPGHVTDKSLVESSGLLFKLLPGDVVLAERDFDIDDLVDARKAKFEITSNYVKSCQSGQNEEGPSLMGAYSDKQNVHMHVERVIEMVKRRYCMLTGPVESPFTVIDRTSNVSTFDKIVQVACALNNLCISAAPLE